MGAMACVGFTHLFFNIAWVFEQPDALIVIPCSHKLLCWIPANGIDI